jgi:serine/threonine-protein kinase
VLVYQSLTKTDDGANAGASTVLDNYVGQTLESVTGALKALGLAYEAVPEPNATVAEGFVHRTDPPAGTIVVDGQVIKLFYNPTKALVAVPNVAGRSIEEARQILAQSGFQITEEPELNDDVPEGIVIRTDPPADSNVPQEQTITVFVSSGPNQVSVPAIIINTKSDIARQTLESAEFGLKVEIQEQVDPVIPVGIVISSNPPPNTFVDRGSTVVLIVSSGPGQERVPPLVGLTEGQAFNLLSDRGFVLDPNYTELAPGDPRDGTVLEQSIAPSTLVDKGTVIAVVIGQARVAQTTTTSTTTTTTTLAPVTTPPPPPPSSAP